MAQNTLKGNIALTIDELELAASVTFTPDSDGAEWNGEKLSRMFLDNKLNQVSSRICDDLVKTFGKTKTPLAETVARGVPPEEPSPEKAEWTELEIPDRFKAISGRILGGAPPPELFRIRTEKIKTEQVVKKPSPIPFMPPKEETIVTWEKKEISEKVSVDFSAKKSGYAKKGDVIGTVSPPKQGKQGKSIYGKPIPVAALENSQFFTGKGVSRNRNQFIADLDGFVRIGSIWVDMVPFMDHGWEVRQSTDGRGMLLDFNPGNPELPLPDAQQILEKAISLGAGKESLVPAETLAKAIQGSFENREALSGFMLFSDADSEIIHTMAPDKTLATLTLKKCRGNGKPLDFRQVSEIIRKCGYKGLDLAAVKAALIAFRDGNDPVLEKLVLARGTPATRGKGRELAVSLDFLPDEQAKAIRDRLIENPSLFVGMTTLGEFQLADADKIALVQKDQEMASLTKPEPGKNGLDIAGSVIPGIPGNDPDIRALENTHISQGTVVSEVSGIVMYHEHEGTHFLRALPYRDASIEISVSDDRMKAAISLRRQIGAGKPLSSERVMEMVKEKGITYGISEKVVLELVRAALGGQIILKVPFASGKPGVAAGGSSIDWKVDFIVRNDAARSARTCHVAKDQLIALMKTASGSGESGTDILGNKIDPPAADAASEPGIDASILKRTEADGSTSLIAASAGVLSVTPSSIMVQAQYRVPSDVGAGTGNIKFPGTIKVEGAVKSGYMVISGGDMLIRGTVEAAILSSNGKIVAAQGIRGERKATLHAKTTIDTAFAEQATLLAVEDIRIQGPCGMCFVKTNGKVALTGAKGALVGGLVRAKKGIEVQELGSARGTKTEISFGQDYLIQDQIETEDREMEKIKQALIGLDSKIRNAHKAGASIADLGSQKVKLVKLMEKRSIRSFTLKEKYEEHFPSEIIVKGTVYPGVILESHNRLYEVKQLRKGVRFSFDRANGRIVEKPI